MAHPAGTGAPAAMRDWLTTPGSLTARLVAHYAGAHQHVIQGSDHAVSEFEQYVDEVLAFCLTDNRSEGDAGSDHRQ